jgi:hypothetical protein
LKIRREEFVVKGKTDIPNPGKAELLKEHRLTNYIKVNGFDFRS